ncbi:MAG: hypothetical protein IPH05_02875 [Flavobacteriales bacterium]|nr:hypothetical protein [Flavobacteriales bacterium]MBK6881893.1 hypothetical protein [Flavobacteriales bacterium]MBK7102453.1 hypothetical protein [Flavobacteriales bacterium]MBK7113192.1 hypothetical protein [Flavobacteriales bacterium]MBK7482808.1 hypothetical protein [Flavobacteriales bacterium]
MDRSAPGTLLACVLLMTACGGNGHRDVVIDDVPLELRIERLDQAVFRTDTHHVGSLRDSASVAFGSFFRIYIEDILQGVPIEDPRLPLMLERFRSDPDWSDAQHAADSVLGDLEEQRQRFEDAFKRLHVLFPDSLIPRVVAFNSGYNFGIYPTDSVLGIGVEWFIGPDQPVIGFLAPDAFPQFVKERMRPAMMVPSAMKGWLLVHYTHDIGGEDLLTNLVETGKVMVLLDALLPETEADLKFAFSKEQLAWCEANEYAIWKDLVGKDQLYSRNADVIGRFMNDGPFTNGLPRESPGHVGEWIGYRMVKAYMNDNPDLTFEQLIQLKDPRLVLKSYKPR